MDKENEYFQGTVLYTSSSNITFIFSEMSNPWKLIDQDVDLLMRNSWLRVITRSLQVLGEWERFTW